MKIGLAHVSVRCRDLEASLQFYTGVLGLRSGPRPPFDFAGAWLYGEAGGAPHGMVHLIGEGAEGYLGQRTQGGSALDHVAFSATDWPGLQGKLQHRDIPYTERTVPGLGLRQVFLTDPDGIVIELNFEADF